MRRIDASKQAIRDFYHTHLKQWTASLLLVRLYFALNRGHYTLLDNADLIIHEAGHVFFILLGPFLRIAGGTLMQILLPSILVGYFYAHHYRFGTQVSLFWLGHHFINISVYAADARARVLPLLGGDKAGHDWANMLGLLGLLDYDQIVGGFFYVLALLTFVALLALPRYMLKEQGLTDAASAPASSAGGATALASREGRHRSLRRCAFALPTRPSARNGIGPRPASPRSFAPGGRRTRPR